MPRKLSLSRLQKTALLIAHQNPQGAYSYKAMRVFGYSKSSISRSSRRLERAGLAKRFNHCATITTRARHLIERAMLKPSAGWFVAALSAQCYAGAVRRVEYERGARIVREVIDEYRQETYKNPHSSRRFMVK